jgi:type I restriction enzyme S subunit
MSYLDNLLESVIVEWKPLGDESIGKFIRGGGLQKKDFTETGVGCIHYGQIYTHYGTFTSRTKTFVSKEFAKKARMAKYGDLVIATTSETDEDLCKAVAWLGYDEIAISSDACFYRHNLNPKYVAYFFQTEEFHKQKRPFITGAKVRRVNADNLAKLLIPIPCPNNIEKSLEIQKEIVRILDDFTQYTKEITKEITKELTARKNQYSYYREQLFIFDESDVKYLPMDDESVGEFIRGKRFVKTDMISEGVPCIHYGEMYTHYDTWSDKTKSFVSKELVERKNLRSASKGDVIIVAAGETIEDIGKGTAWLGEEGVVIHDACFYYKSDLNPKYAAYFTRTRQFHDQIKKHIRTGKISAINAKGLGKAIIPIPSLEEQERIVNILDNFDMLTTSLSEVLPKEIELRKKQYEYYRKMLLTFRKDTVEA